MIVVAVSPSKILSEALCGFINTIGFEAHSDASLNADVALHDPTALGRVQALPFSVPTLALTCVGGERPAGAAYRGCLTADETKHTLKQALEAVYRGECWLGQTNSQHLKLDDPVGGVRKQVPPTVSRPEPKST